MRSVCVSSFHQANSLHMRSASREEDQDPAPLADFSAARPGRETSHGSPNAPQQRQELSAEQLERATALYVADQKTAAAKLSYDEIFEARERERARGGLSDVKTLLRDVKRVNMRVKRSNRGLLNPTGAWIFLPATCAPTLRRPTKIPTLRSPLTSYLSPLTSHLSPHLPTPHPITSLTLPTSQPSPRQATSCNLGTLSPCAPFSSQSLRLPMRLASWATMIH